MASLWRNTHDPVDAQPLDGKASGVKPLVLVVEDHDDTRFMLRYLMEVRGCRVLEAVDGEEAVSLAESAHPDLILMDTTLPRLDGLMATQRIRGIASLHDVPIVFLSAQAHPDSRAHALETGGNDYLVKPPRLSDLESAVERHLGKSRAPGIQ